MLEERPRQASGEEQLDNMAAGGASICVDASFWLQLGREPLGTRISMHEEVLNRPESDGMFSLTGRVKQLD